MMLQKAEIMTFFSNKEMKLIKTIFLVVFEGDENTLTSVSKIKKIISDIVYFDNTLESKQKQKVLNLFGLKDNRFISRIR